MEALQSRMENQVELFTHLREKLGNYEFTVGGNWDYDHGYFDRYLDEAHKVWLRIPFTVASGNFDAEADDSDVTVRLGRPYVLKHVYNEGTDPEADAETFGALVDQFQEPADSDAPVEDHWTEEAKSLLNRVEQELLD